MYFSVCINFFILFEEINSFGFLGILPLTNKCKLGILVSFMYFLDNSIFLIFCPVISFIKSDNPFSASTPNKLFFSLGTFKLQSINIVFLFA